ncbi:MAG TPA: hypothetical protein VLT57_01660, partial [Bryobacteraceae bacterium]|nr:hypothetical protein [Bryobacteraceae bacterium]
SRRLRLVLSVLIRRQALFILAVSWAISKTRQTVMMLREEFDPLAPQREAALFYGLFLRGHSAEALRRDIDVPKPILEKWLKTQRYEGNFQQALRRVYSYRKQVLAIFDELVLNERLRPRIQ